GLVTYATGLKQRLLDVPAEVIASEGVVSAGCAVAMARGAASRTGADWALATTGVAGPDLQEGKPVGTVFVGLVGPGVETHRGLALSGDREDVRAGTVAAALDMLAEVLL
ncbi:MAG: nicotinamide-nucleotide amidohydrolase family protein, partial [Actinomycetota bacterium]|nr:nicotinamide-nucleotide amidohydrolase family protein [Actinomycetota bacterium]